MRVACRRKSRRRPRAGRCSDHRSGRSMWRSNSRSASAWCSRDSTRSLRVRGGDGLRASSSLVTLCESLTPVRRLALLAHLEGTGAHRRRSARPGGRGLGDRGIGDRRTAGSRCADRPRRRRAGPGSRVAAPRGRRRGRRRPRVARRGGVRRARPRRCPGIAGTADEGGAQAARSHRGHAPRARAGER